MDCWIGGRRDWWIAGFMDCWMIFHNFVLLKCILQRAVGHPQSKVREKIVERWSVERASVGGVGDAAGLVSLDVLPAVSATDVH